MSDFDKIKNKISNLLDLSESSNEHEAAEKKASPSRAVNKSCKKWGLDQKYAYIEKEIVDLIVIK